MEALLGLLGLPPLGEPSAAALGAYYARNEGLLHRLGALVMIATGVAVLLVELGAGARAAYGRYAAQSSARYYGPTISPKLAWVFQESWSFLVPLALALTRGKAACLASAPNLACLGMYMGHYAYRAFVFPLRMRGGKPMPVGICLLAAAFCVFNGWVQGALWTSVRVRTLDEPRERAVFAAGAALWAVGLAINYHSDGVLRELRRPGETGYKIPRGGAFELVSGANYFGEIVEWCGYALASGGELGAVAFAFFTFANTAPRAHHHHLWYRAKFDDYPPRRRAVIPFVW